jgi:hypothetical protein
MKSLELNGLNLVELDAQGVITIEGGMIHPGGYKMAMNQKVVGEFWFGFFSGLFGY